MEWCQSHHSSCLPGCSSHPPLSLPSPPPAPHLQVVFSEAIWVGSAEANPEELRLDMPPELLADKVHEGYEYCYGAGRAEGAWRQRSSAVVQQRSKMGSTAPCVAERSCPRDGRHVGA